MIDFSIFHRKIYMQIQNMEERGYHFVSIAHSISSFCERSDFPNATTLQEK